MNKITAVLIVVTLAHLWACSGVENDTEAPTISIISSNTILEDTVCGSLANNVINLKSADNLSIQLQLTDNEALSQLKIDIHDNFDCHGHAQKTEDWNLQRIIDLEGSESTQLIEIPVAENVTAGAYHLSLKALDISGNEAEPLYFSIVVLNATDSEKPKLLLHRPSSRNLEVEKDEILNLAWTLKDNEALNGSANSKSVLLYKDESNGNFFNIKELPIDDKDETFTKDFNNEYQIPQSWISGRKYSLIIRGYDAVNNQSYPLEIGLTVN